MFKIKELNEIKEVTLTKVSKQVIAEVDLDFVVSSTKDIVESDTIELKIPKYTTSQIDKKKIRFSLYDEIDFERYICVNNKEQYVIKDISIKGKKDEKRKEVVAYSIEKKLTKFDFEVEDIGFQLRGKDEEKGIYSLDEYMYKETGWRFGHIDESVQYDISEDGTKSEKLRWQESVTTNWHDFLTNMVREQFECVVFFNTETKEVNLYNIDSFGDEIVLSLSYDGFLKDLEIKGSTDDLVTRMTLKGNEDVNILEETPTGYPYIEDYSYFIENQDMSDELITALTKYTKMVKIRTVTWNELRKQRVEKQKELDTKRRELLFIVGEIEGLKGQINAYNAENDAINKAKAIEELTKKKDEFTTLDIKVTDLEEEVRLIKESIKNINILCKRETATDENGVLIFNQQLFDELKDFIYYDSYSNDSFLSVSDLIKAGERQLSLKCKPTKTWTVDSVNFMKRLLKSHYRKTVNFTIGLGNIIELCSDDDEVELVYFTGFKKDLKSGELSLTLSNKKITNSDLRVIGDKLYKAEKATKAINRNRYLWVQQKKNRINLEHPKGR